MTSPLVSIILPTYNGEEFVEECLNSIKKQTFKDYELIIIDDCSQDNTVKILEKRRYKVRKNKENLGAVKTFNKGIKLAKGDFIFPIDQDMDYDKNCIEECLNAIKSDKKAGMSGIKCYYYKQKNKIRSFGLKVNLLTSKTTNIGRDEIDRGQFDHLRERNSIGLGLGLIRKEVFEKAGLFSEDYHMYYCDVDFSLKVGRAKYKIMFSKAKAWHKKQEKEKLSKKQFITFVQDKITFMKKNSNFYVLFLLGLLCFYLPFKILRGNFSIKFLRDILEKI